MTTGFWDLAFSWWTVLVAGMAVVATVWLAVLNVRRHAPSGLTGGVEAVRVVAVVLLAATLFRPERVRVSRHEERPLVAVLMDASGSMRTRDVLAEPGRAVTRESWLAPCRTNAFWDGLRERYDVAVNAFSACPAPTNIAAMEQAGTDIDAALDGARREYDRLRAVLLLSDGDWNEGRPPAAAATALRVEHVPVYTIAVGSDRFLPDLELVSVAAPAYGLMDEYISVAFTVQSRLPRDAKTTVVLSSDRGFEADKDIVVPAMARYQGTITLVPKQEGQFVFTLKLPVQKDEVIADNNEKSFTMALRREELKVLLVESVPRWEYRYLHNALDRDPGASVSCVLFHGHGMRQGDGRDYLPAFPASRDDLSRYDVVFLGDVGIGGGELTEDDARLLKGLVEQQGSGLVFLPGPGGRESTLVDSPLGELMPVVFDPTGAGFGIGMESHLALTTRGSDHFLTMLAPTPVENLAVWKRLPGFYWHAGVVRSKPGTDVLAVHETARNEYGRIPLLVTSPAGNGKVLFMGTDGAWRWRRGVEDTYHYRFWGQVVRWMAHQRHLAHDEGIRFFYSPEAPQRGDTVFLHATVFSDMGLPLEQGRVYVDVTDTAGRAQRIALQPEPGGWGVFTGGFTAENGGRHTVRVTCDETGREVSTTLDVAVPVKERVGRPARVDVLREIAAITGGRSGKTGDLPAIMKDIALLPESSPREERLRLWCHPLWGGLIVGLLALYWVCRKLMGRL